MTVIGGFTSRPRPPATPYGGSGDVRQINSNRPAPAPRANNLATGKPYVQVGKPRKTIRRPNFGGPNSGKPVIPRKPPFGGPKNGRPIIRQPLPGGRNTGRPIANAIRSISGAVGNATGRPGY